MFNLTYNAASMVPPPQGIAIVDTIDNRDMIIDKLLERIHKKYSNIEKENEELREKLASISQQSINNKTPLSCNTTPIIRFDNSGNKYIILTESTRKGYEMCVPFSSRDYNIEYSSSDGDSIHIEKYDELHEIISNKGKEIRLPGHNIVNPILPLSLTHIDPFSQENLDIDSNEEMDVDYIENMFFDYGSFSRKKKYMSALIGLATDYISSSVYVEKMIDTLSSIIKDMNEDTRFIDKIFEGLLKDDEKGEIGIIFKGGNVYKLFTQIMNNQLDYNVFQNYLDDVDRFFKKSDCDFSIVLIIAKNNNGTVKKIFKHLERNTENENRINTLQFMILNKYRNIFLKDKSYEYLTMCGKNDIIMSAKMNDIMSTMLNIVILGRIEFEQKVLKILTAETKFRNGNGYITNELDKLLNSPATTIRSTYNLDKLLEILEFRPEFDAVNDTNLVGIQNGKLIDWFKLFMAYALRDHNFLPPNDNNKFANITGVFVQEKPNVIINLQQISTDTMEWRDVKTLYNVIGITNILIGDHSYPNTSIVTKQYILNDENLFRELITTNTFPDKVAEVSSYRMKELGRIHSNRNDFFIKFTKSQQYQDPISGHIIIDDFMYTKSIPFSANIEGEQQSLKTPFYISINKEIKGISDYLGTNEGKRNFTNNIAKLAFFGSSGTKKMEESPYLPSYKRIKENLKEYKEPMNNFCLARLMTSFVAIFVTNKSQYFSIPLAAEYIDLSYTFAGDNKAFIYEAYDEYIPFSGKIGRVDIDTILTEYDELSKYVNASNFTPTQSFSNETEKKTEITKLRLAVAHQSYDVLKTDNNIKAKLSAIVTNLNKLTNILPYNTNVDDNIIILLKIIKYFLFYGDKDKQLRSINYDNIYFPKLNAFILDLYTILFVDAQYPWIDTKYSKRLQRLIFFIFIEKLQSVNYGNIRVILYDLGIKTKYDPNDPKQKQPIQSKQKQSKQPKQPKQLKFNPQIDLLMSKIAETQSYENQYKISRNYKYFEYRNEYVYDTETLEFNEVSSVTTYYNLISACGIDHFMYSYHLLDFFPVYKIDDTDLLNPFFRSRYIKKQKMDNDEYYYVIISLTEQEATNINEINKSNIEKIFADIPTNLNDYSTNKNESIKLFMDDEKYVDRYELLNPTLKDNQFAQNMLQYIATAELIRERLLITIFNYTYDTINTLVSKKYIIVHDPTHILVNIYEGDIDKILTVI